MWSAIHPTSPLLRHPNKECVAGWEDIRGISWDLIQGMERGGISWNWTTRPHIIYISYYTHIMSYPTKGVICGDQSPGTPRKNNWWQDLVEFLRPTARIKMVNISRFWKTLTETMPRVCDGNKTVLINLRLSLVNRALLCRVAWLVSDMVRYRSYPCDVQYRRWVSPEYPGDGLYHPVSQSPWPPPCQADFIFYFVPCRSQICYASVEILSNYLLCQERREKVSFIATLMFLSFDASSDLGFWLCPLVKGPMSFWWRIHWNADCKSPGGLQAGLPVIDPLTNPEVGIQIWLRWNRKHSLN